MKLQKILKTGVLLLATTLFIACGGGSSVDLSKFIAFVNGAGPAPTMQDYQDVGVSGVNGKNLATINAFISTLTEPDVDTKGEIQDIADKYGVTLNPVAVIKVSRLFAADGESFRFSADNSVDRDGAIVGFEWKEGDNVLFTIPTFDITGLSVGKHTITLTVTDEDGHTGTTSVTVTVQAVDSNAKPIANAGPDQNYTVKFVGQLFAASPTPTPPPAKITLDGSGSSDDGKIQPLTYTWTKLGSNTQNITLQNANQVKATFSLSCNDSTMTTCFTNQNLNYSNQICPLEFQLTVDDGEKSSSDTVIINANYWTYCGGA